MKATEKNLRRVLAPLLFVVGIVFLCTRWSIWPWSIIGVILGFAGLLLMLLQGKIEKYGNSHVGLVNAATLGNQGGRPLARLLAPYVFAVGVPFVVLGAVFQIIGNPSNKLFMRGSDIPKDVVYRLLYSDRNEIDPMKLDKALTTLDENEKSVEAKLRTITYPELLIVNCGATNECVCPAGYTRVKDTGEWNLNAGAKGDSITLCVRNARHAEFQD